MSKPKSFHLNQLYLFFFSNLKIYQYAINMTYKNRREEISKSSTSTNFIYLFFFSNLNNCTIYRYAVGTTQKKNSWRIAMER